MIIDRYLSYEVGHLRTTTGGTTDHQWRHIDGYVHTPHGTVGVWSWSNDNGAGTVRLEMMHNGALYSWREQRRYEPRYIVTLAKRFAAQVTQQQEAGND